MKKKLKITGIIIITFLFIQQCTTINLIPSFVNNKGDYKYISDIIDSEEWNINRLTDKATFITYDTINNYFIVDTGFDKMKIDSKGKIVLNIAHPSGEIPHKTHFLFTDSTALDLSKNDLKPKSFKKIINPKEKTLEKKWKIIFEEYYNAAQTVIYGDELIYMKVDTDWILFHLEDDDYLRGTPATERTYDGFPAKNNDVLIFLKESESLLYSDGSSPWSHNQQNYNEDKLKYPSQIIDKISFSKEKIDENFAYTPISARFEGTGYYKLKKGDKYLRFKERTYKMSFKFLETENYIKHFVLPSNFESKTDISFINCVCSKNDNYQGTYIINQN